MTDTECSDYLVGLTREQLESLPWSIAKTSGEGFITYGNRKLCELIGKPEAEGINISELFSGKHLDVVRQHLESRYKGVADEYEVMLKRGDLEIPVLVSAFPERDAQGNTIGSIAFVRELSISKVAHTIHKQIEELSSGHEILNVVATESQQIVPFDFLSVTLISASGEHYRPLYLYPENQLSVTTRWWPITPFAKKLLARKESMNIPDIEEWLKQPEWEIYAKEPDVQAFLAQGYRCSLSIPVVRGDTVVASIGLNRKEELGVFTQLEEERLDELPLAPAVRMALHYEEVENLEFLLRLIRRINSAAETIENIAEIIVEEIANYYQWENVSIFRPDEQDGNIWLVKQKYSSEEFRLDEDWHHPIDKGFTGEVFRTGKPVNVTDIKSAGHSDVYLQGYAGTISEMCLPIKVQGRVYWLLNIEDSKKNAFAPEEMQALQNIIRELTLVLERSTQYQIFTELLKRTKDVVIQTDFFGTIIEVNPAVRDILGYSEIEMIGTPLVQYFEDSDQAQLIQEADYVPNDELLLLCKDGSEIRVMFSGSSLPREIGRKFYVASDLSSRKRKETLEILRYMYNEIASQIKTPLSMAFTWLGMLERKIDAPENLDLIGKTIRQLNRVDLSYDRLLLFERDETLIPTDMRLFKLAELLEMIKERLPVLDAEKLRLQVSSDVPPIRGDVYQISFCLESLVSYLLRFTSEAGTIDLDVSNRGGRIVISMRGHAPEVTGSEITDYADSRWAIRTVTEMALGEEIVKRFIEQNHGGVFRILREEDRRVDYVIELPVAGD